MDDMGDAISFWNFERKKTKEERERVIFSYIFFRFKLCHKTSFNQSNEKLTKNKINIFFIVGTGLANFVYLCTLSRKLNS